MAIVIPHRFIDRLLPCPTISHIDTVIIGTFNPGLPIIEHLTADELLRYKEIESGKKFQKFNEVKNFYDRPQNRFWKIMDAYANPTFYTNGNYKARNPNGLKFYNKYDRDIIFRNQDAFCKQRGLFITDIVRQIEPDSFEGIYDNFPDSAIEKASCSWNTDGILDAINKYKPNRVLINFKTGKSLSRISAEIDRIRAHYPNLIFEAMSTSGAAGNTYQELVNKWHALLESQANEAH